MPELPDVEGFRRVVASCVRGRAIERVEVHDEGVLHEVTARRFCRELTGRTFATPERHGKWLFLHTDGPVLMVHFGMTGEFVCGKPDDALAPHDRVVFTVVGGRQLRYRDQRKLKGIWWADDAEAARTEQRQGPDALSVERATFDSALSGRRGGVKSLLSDQSVLAGLGNLLADEILWRARLHPTRQAASLTDEERGRLYSRMREVLRSSARAGRVPRDDDCLTGHRNDRDGSCPRCGGPLRRTRVAGRSTVWCPRCQPERS